LAIVCRFEFPAETDGDIVEKHLALAIVTAECNFGQPRVRTAAAYCISPVKDDSNGSKELQVAIDVSTDVGEHIAQVFTGLMIRQLGEDKFKIERVRD